METKNIPNSQSNLEKEAEGNRLPDFRQSYSNQDSMVLAQNEKHRSMEQDRKPRDKSMHLWVHLIFDKGGKTTQWIKQSL